jgi:hypothetical protein
MSALPPKADIAGRQLDVRFVPEGKNRTAAYLMVRHRAVIPDRASDGYGVRSSDSHRSV